jgi:hypothetical protein
MTDAERDARVQAAAWAMRSTPREAAGLAVAAADAAAPGGGVVSRAEVAELIGDEQHPDWTDYLATNLLELLRAAPDTGDWHGVLRAWCERQSSGKIEPNRPGGGVVSRAEHEALSAELVAAVERAEAEVERLREARDAHEQDATMCHEVATDLRRERGELRAEVERLREALRGLYDFLPRYSCKADAPDGCPVCVARAALSPKPEGDEG